jgi:hypothetical protein
VEKTTCEGALCCLLFNKYHSGDKIKKRCAGHVACVGKRMDAYRVLMGRLEGRRPLRRRRRRWEDNIKMNL